MRWLYRMEDRLKATGRVREHNARLDRLDDLRSDAASSRGLRASPNQQRAGLATSPSRRSLSRQAGSTLSSVGPDHSSSRHGMQLSRRGSITGASRRSSASRVHEPSPGADSDSPPTTEAADAAIDSFLLRLRRAGARHAALSIQSYWRYVRHHRTILPAMLRRREYLGPFVSAWRAATLAERHNRRRLKAFCVDAWREELAQSYAAFRHLGRGLMNSRGASGVARTWRLCVYYRMSANGSSGESYPNLDGDDIGNAARGKDWVRKSLQLCLRVELRNRTFAVWRRYVRWIDRRRTAAGHRLQKFARPMRRWPTETVALCLVMWKRLAKLKASKRLGLPSPVYPDDPLWEWEELVIKEVARKARKEAVYAQFQKNFLARIWRAWRETKGAWRRTVSIEPWELHMLDKVCN